MQTVHVTPVGPYYTGYNSACWKVILCFEKIQNVRWESDWKGTAFIPDNNLGF